MLVMSRRVSYGSKAEQGLHFVERILSVVEACRRRGMNSWQFITDCIKASWSGRPVPSLPPA